MEKKLKLEKFNEKEGRPFYIVDLEDGSYSLCLRLNFLPEEYKDFGQKAFNQYAITNNEPVEENGYHTHGDGYEWREVFKEAFKNEENLKKITFDCEAAGFYCNCEDLDVLIDFAIRFKELCMDEKKFENIVIMALTEFYREKSFDEENNTVKWCMRDKHGMNMEICTGDYQVVVNSADTEKLLSGEIVCAIDMNSRHMVVIDGKSLLGYKVIGFELDIKQCRICMHVHPVSEGHGAVHPLLIGRGVNGDEKLYSMQDVAEFICSQKDEVKILYDDGSYFMNAKGGFIRRAADLAYFKEVAEVLFSMRMERISQESNETDLRNQMFGGVMA